jgi:hypothetical protein
LGIPLSSRHLPSRPVDEIHDHPHDDRNGQSGEDCPSHHPLVLSPGRSATHPGEEVIPLGLFVSVKAKPTKVAQTRLLAVASSSATSIDSLAANPRRSEHLFGQCPNWVAASSLRLDIGAQRRRYSSQRSRPGFARRIQIPDARPHPAAQTHLQFPWFWFISGCIGLVRTK